MRRSVACWRMRPEVKVLASALLTDENEAGFGLRRCDSEMSRRSSRSWARREGASSGRLEEGAAFDCVAGVVEGDWSGGRDDLKRTS